MKNEFLLKMGFKYAGACECMGGRTQKYKLGSYTVYLTKSRFKVVKAGYTIKSPTNVEVLETYIQTIFAGKQVPGSPGLSA